MGFLLVCLSVCLNSAFPTLLLMDNQEHIERHTFVGQTAIVAFDSMTSFLF
jgi:hypothetical protein